MHLTGSMPVCSRMDRRAQGRPTLWWVTRYV